MSAFKGTPGPWSVSKRHPRRVTAKGVMVSTAVLRNQGGGGSLKVTKDRDEAEANALLIAASPELLEAASHAAMWLRACIKCRNFPWDEDQREAAEDVLEFAITTIAKATGGDA